MVEIRSNFLINQGIVSLTQAMLGAISENFRMVTLCIGNGCWNLRFYLAKDSEEDGDEISDIVEEFNIFQDGDGLRTNFDIIVTMDELEVQPPGSGIITVFMRK